MEKSEQEAYYELSYYTLSHSNQDFIHQHIVDIFTAQTADGQTKPISLVFALIGLYLYLEKNYNGRQVQQAHLGIAKKKKKWPAFNIPDQKGDISVIDVLKISPGKERDEIIRKWGISVWGAYAKEHKKVIDFAKVEFEEH